MTKEIPIDTDSTSQSEEASFSSWLVVGPRPGAGEISENDHPPSFKVQVPIGLGTIRNLWEEYKTIADTTAHHRADVVYVSYYFSQWLRDRGAVILVEDGEKRPLQVSILK